MSGQMTKVFVADARRRWSEEEKQAIIEESKTNPVARVAKKHGVAVSLLFRWRKAAGIRVRGLSPHSLEGKFVRVALPVPVAAAAANGGQGSIEIVLGSGRRVIVGKDVDANTLKRVLAILEDQPVCRSSQSEGR
jgi:transposase